MNANIFCLALVVLLSAGCSKGVPERSAAATATSTFTSEIIPILQARCAACHLTGSEAGSLSLVPEKAFTSLVDKPSVEIPSLKRVTPGDPDNSYLIMKLEGTHSDHGGSGVRMPFGAPPLSQAEITKIRAWIASGAKA